jgi:hypothetical protein
MHRRLEAAERRLAREDSRVSEPAGKRWHAKRDGPEGEDELSGRDSKDVCGLEDCSDKTTYTTRYTQVVELHVDRKS